MNRPEALKIIPKPGFCVKLKSTTNEKVFVNVCTDEQVPKPRDVTEQELTKILEDLDSAPLYKIPMSVSEAHEETDKVGSKCTAYDVIINDQFMKIVRDSQLFEAFLMTVIIEGLEQKYGLSLERSWIVLKNKTHHGTLLEQMVRADSRPKIEELDKQPIITKLEHLPTDSAAARPAVDFSYVPNQDRPEFIIAAIKLPKLRSSRFLQLDAAEDALRLACPRSNAYQLETDLLHRINPTGVSAEFNLDNKTLTVTMPVAGALAS